jgi:two-component sensor histidine kinase
LKSLHYFVYKQREGAHDRLRKEGASMDAILVPQSHSTSGRADLVAEANHRIANSLTLLISMVRMEARTIKKGGESFSNAEVRHLLDGVAARISAISQLHRMLSSGSDQSVISLRPHLHNITDALVAALSSGEQLVKVVHTGSDCMVMMQQVQPIVLMLCEIFINAMKYAHPSGVPLIMVVDCTTSQDGQLVLTISDDGVGLPEGFDPSTGGGTGFKVMRSLAAEIGANLDIRSTHLGLSTRASLPGCAMAGAMLA